MKTLSKIATGSLGLALLFSSLTAVGANAVEAGADGQINGDRSSGCVVDWTARAMLDQNMNNIPRGLRAGPYATSGFMESVHPRHGSQAILENHHWFNPNLNLQYWRIPIGANYEILPGAELTVDLPDDMTNIQFFGELSSQVVDGDVDRFMRGQTFGALASNLHWDLVPTATQTDAARNIWTLKFNQGLPLGHAAVIEFVGSGDHTKHYEAMSHLSGLRATDENGNACSPIPEPSLTVGHCQAGVVGRTVFSPYSQDIDRREKYADSWHGTGQLWGEAGADGWDPSRQYSDAAGATRRMRFYAATTRELNNATMTVSAPQGATFDEASIASALTPGAGQLVANGFSQSVTGISNPTVSADKKTLTFTVAHMPENSSFSVEVSAVLTGEKAHQTPTSKPMVFFHTLVGSIPGCDVSPTPTTPATTPSTPATQPTPEQPQNPKKPAPLAHTGAAGSLLVGLAGMSLFAGMLALKRRRA